MKRFLIAFLLVVSTFPLLAMPDMDDYTGFKIKKELWVCTSVAFPVDISYDAFFVDFKTVVKGGLGYFMQVKPGEHKDGTVYPDASSIILNPSKGVLNTVGKPAGVYEFIFVSTDDNFCGLSHGEQAVVRVYLLPQLIGFPVLSNVCPGGSVDVNFNDYLPSEIRYFINEMGWTVSYKRNNVAITMPIKANLNTVGNNVYEYTINDASGAFTNKYTEMQATVYACPEDSAFLTHTVRIREDECAIPDKEVTFCMHSLLSVPETWSIMKSNLFTYLGTSVSGGKWSVAKFDGIPVGDLNLDTDNGDVYFPISVIKSQAMPYDVIFKYSYKGCLDNDTATTVKVIFSEDFTEIMDEKEKDVCRNLVSGVVDLSSIFGFEVPLTSGIWYEKVGADFNEMLYGAVDITDKQSGSLYTYRYDVSSANDELCLVEGLSTLLHLRIRDAEIIDAEATICTPQFEAGVTIDLFKYVPGLNDSDRIDPSKVKWRDPSGALILNPTTYLFKAEGEIKDSTQTFIYQFDIVTECGTSTGNLYLSTIDSLQKNTHKTIQICFTDDYAHHVDLFQVLGVVGLNGKFVVDVTDPAGKDPSASYNETTGILNANAAFDTTNEVEKYTFVYQPSGDEECVPDNVKVTVVVTKEIKD